jgi:acylphosphatase
MRWPWQRDERHSYEETTFSHDSPAPTVPAGAARRRILFSGSVQGVGFRFSCQMAADAHGLTGWVENLDDGDVLTEVQGQEEGIEAFLDDILHPRGRVFYHARVAGSEAVEPVAESGYRVVG